MRTFSLTLLYASSILMFLGGVGDQFINQLLDVHLEFLGNPEQSELLSKSEDLLLLMLHSLGGGLMSCGIAMFALVHFGIRNNQAWAKWTFLIIAFIAQGFNGYAMYSAGSYYIYPLMILVLVLVGIISYRDR